MTNPELASLFNELADIMEIAGENHFKIRAYRNASKAISGTHDNVAEMEPEKLVQITGIGKAISEKIKAAAGTGTFPALEKWRQSQFSSLRTLLHISGFTIRRLRTLIKDFEISSLEDLKKALPDEKFKSYDKIDSETREKIIWIATTPNGPNQRN